MSPPRLLVNHGSLTELQSPPSHSQQYAAAPSQTSIPEHPSVARHFSAHR